MICLYFFNLDFTNVAHIWPKIFIYQLILRRKKPYRSKTFFYHISSIILGNFCFFVPLKLKTNQFKVLCKQTYVYTVPTLFLLRHHPKWTRLKLVFFSEGSLSLNLEEQFAGKSYTWQKSCRSSQILQLAVGSDKTNFDALC